MTRRRRRPTKPSRPASTLRTSPGIDVVVPVFNQLDMLDDCLEALSQQDVGVPMRLFIVDDYSEPRLKVADYNRITGFEGVRIVRNRDNRGFLQSANRGAKLGNQEFILFLNSDVTLVTGSVSAMWEEFKDEEVGVVGARLIFPLNSTDPTRPAGTIQHAGMVIGLDGKPFHVHIGWPLNHPRVMERLEMQAITGACMMTRRVLWNEVGGFNEVYGRGTFEDVEYCLMARTLQKRVIYQPNAVGYHFVGGSVNDPSKGFPVRENQMVWMLRCGNYTFWDEWRFW